MLIRRMLAGAMVFGVFVGGCVVPTLVIFPATLPDGAVGIGYSATLSVEASGSVQFSISQGELPAGLRLRSDGQITGTPTSSGTFSFTVLADTSTIFGGMGSESYTIEIFPELTVDADLDVGRLAVAYESFVEIAGGVPPYRVTAVGLPAGLSVNRSNGRVSGTPVLTTTGTLVEFTVTDSGDPRQEKTASVTLVIKPEAVNITTTTLANGMVGSAYNERLFAEDGQTPYEWSVVAGLLPDGLSLNRDTGVISGTPEEAGAVTFTVEVRDSDSPLSSDEQELTLTIDPQPVEILTDALAAGQVGMAYTDGLVAINGTQPFMWSLSAGTLPDGLMLDATTGEITGTPTAAGMNTFSITVTDSADPPTTATEEFTITTM